ncbi:hypothetical protein M3Y94_00149800 [Aphelenchoides besseyi]|nr:hypothetical protein M3Y94_00149800 [Aphelenchoides besseyi]KAI6237167.1 hypothetical protein M3Y95_00236700 [Aphelenchoides besseyi]
MDDKKPIDDLKTAKEMDNVVSSQSQSNSIENQNAEPLETSLATETKSGTQTAVERSTRRRVRSNATKLNFMKINGRPDMARVALLLCNISDRPLYYRLKSNAGVNVSALPSSSGHVAAHGSCRCVITWTRPEGVDSWANVEAPKMLLSCRFLDGNNELTTDMTAIRLLAHISTKGTCLPNNPPVEQLLLDANTKPMEDGSAESMTIFKPQTPKQESEKQEANNSVGNFVNQLTSQQLALLIICLLILFLALYNNASRSSKHSGR